MKSKLIIHYAVSFLIACLVVMIVNIVGIGMSIYRADALYNYHPEEMIEDFKTFIQIDSDGEVYVTEMGVKELTNQKMGIQILDENSQEVFQYQKPEVAPIHYSNTALVKLYANKRVTLFVDEKTLGGITYTYLIFQDANKVKRVTYTYDAKRLKEAHHFPILILTNVSLILIISLLYTLKITRPINRLINQIAELYKGNYLGNYTEKGIYFEVEEYLNQLAKQLRDNDYERKKLEEMREEWIANISHDIKTPLTAIIGNTEIMADTEYELSDGMRVNYCNKILAKSEYIKTLVEELNLSTRLKNNTLVLNKKEVNMVSLMRHVIIDLINNDNEREDQINFRYIEEDIFLEVDEHLMKRVFMNLILNAFTHNEDEVQIVVQIQKGRKKEIIITIEDNGKGIEQEELGNIFKRYYRGTDTRKKTEGLGLGMAIAHDIIRIHEGEIIASSRLGEGLKIKIKLP